MEAARPCPFLPYPLGYASRVGDLITAFKVFGLGARASRGYDKWRSRLDSVDLPRHNVF